MTFDYKKYSLEHLENWLHDTLDCEDLTAQDIYETITSIVDENIEHHKKYLDKNIKLLSLLKGHRNIEFDDVLKERTYYEGWEGYDDFESPLPIQYTEEELNAMCDKAASDEEKEKCREYNLREAEYYDKRAQLDIELEAIKSAGGFEWTPPVEVKKSKYYYDYDRNDINRKNPFKTQNGVTHTNYTKAKIEANSAWNDGWTQEYYQKIVDKYEGKKTLNYDEAIAAGWTMTDDGFWMPPQNKKKWVLPVEECKDADTDETEYFVSFPQDLLEAAKLKEGDKVQWIDNGNGTFTIVKVTKPLGPDEC